MRALAIDDLWRRRFAFVPVRVCDHIVWLEHYWIRGWGDAAMLDIDGASEIALRENAKFRANRAQRALSVAP